MRGTSIGFVFTLALLPLAQGTLRTGDLLQRQASSRAQAEAIVAQVVRADYAGDRAALERLDRELSSLQEDPAIASLVRYWRGFALWRRAINGFNDSTAPAELESDLKGAIRQFDEALRRDPAFSDAMVGRLSCLGYLMYLGQKDAAGIKELASEFRPLADAAMSAAPDNPRLLWVLGPSRWYTAPTAPAAERDARQTAAIASYQRGLELVRAQRGRVVDRLTPAWGEPELLMSLAWSHLNKNTPDASAAEKYAAEALALVPYWHYVRDILLPQIRSAKQRDEETALPAILSGGPSGPRVFFWSLAELVHAVVGRVVHFFRVVKAFPLITTD